MGQEIENILTEMKGRGIEGAVVRVDGVLVHSTIALKEATASVLALTANSGDALLKRFGDQQRQIQLSLSDSLLVMLPIKNHIFCGLVRNPDDKKIVAEFAEKAKNYIV